MKSIIAAFYFLKKILGTMPTFNDARLIAAGGAINVPRGTMARTPKKKEKSVAAKATGPAVIHDDKFEGVQAGKATGKVIFAEENTVGTFGRGKAYKTFTVVLKTTSGEVGFSGVDLQKQFDNGAFSVGDTVTIEKETVDFFVEIKGEKRKRSKNSFKITVLKKGRY